MTILPADETTANPTQRGNRAEPSRTDADVMALAFDVLGFPPKVRFGGRNQALADEAKDVLCGEHPMTLRQLFYRLISAGALQNRHAEYRRLCRVMTLLREMGNVPRAWLVDHLRQTLKKASWSGLLDYRAVVRDCYRKNFWASLPQYVAVFCEKDATAGTIQQVTEKYDVPLHVCRGYCSISFASEIAEDWSAIEKPIHALYCGDYDPSGYDLERDLRDKLARYSGSDFTWERLAIRRGDFDDFSLIRLPVKQTDSRWRRFVEEHGAACAELDALPPNELRRRVEEAILQYIDADEWNRLCHIEQIERDSVARVWDGLDLGQVGGDRGSNGRRKRRVKRSKK